jgi:hypothetical protein
MSKSTFFPEYPRVEACGNRVMIIQEDGSSILWGIERSHSVAERAANDIQLWLRAVNYVKKAVFDKLNSLSDDLLETGIPEEYIGQLLLEGYASIAEIMIDLNKFDLSTNIILNE